jgi:hypothetical protein
MPGQDTEGTMSFVTEGVHRGKAKVSRGYFAVRKTPSRNKRQRTRCERVYLLLALDGFNSRLGRTLPSESIGSALADIRH